MLLCVIRLVDVDTDLLISLNVPLQPLLPVLTQHTQHTQHTQNSPVRTRSPYEQDDTHQPKPHSESPGADRDTHTMQTDARTVLTEVRTEVRAIGKGSKALLSASSSSWDDQQPSVTGMFFSKVGVPIFRLYATCYRLDGVRLLCSSRIVVRLYFSFHSSASSYSCRFSLFIFSLSVRLSVTPSRDRWVDRSTTAPPRYSDCAFHFFFTYSFLLFLPFLFYFLFFFPFHILSVFLFYFLLLSLFLPFFLFYFLSFSFLLLSFFLFLFFVLFFLFLTDSTGC